LNLGEVVADGVDIFIEVSRGGSNLLRLKRGMGSGGGAPAIRIERLVMRGAAVQASIFGRIAAFNLPEIELRRVDLAGLALALAGRALAAVRARAARTRGMPKGRKRPAPKRAP
jgi:hypothetical protein